MKKLSFLLLTSTGLFMNSCAREEENFCSEPQIEPGTEKIVKGSCEQSAEVHKTVSKKEI